MHINMVKALLRMVEKQNRLRHSKRTEIAAMVHHNKDKFHLTLRSLSE